MNVVSLAVRLVAHHAVQLGGGQPGGGFSQVAVSQQ